MTETIKKFILKWKIAILGLFIFIVYLTTSSGETPYNYFIRLADAFLHGRYWLTENPPWLNELINAGNNKFYVPYAPMPSILSIPFVYIFGNNFPQQYIAHILGMIIALSFYKIALKISKNKLIAVWILLLTSFGNIIWFLSSAGSSWYLGQLSGAAFLTLAISESLGKNRLFLVGMFLGTAYLSRIHLILLFPFFIFNNKKITAKDILKLVFGISPFFVFNTVYNLFRFGSFWDKGYTLIPGLFDEPWYRHGLFSPLYIPNHLKIFFASFPIFQKGFPFIKPSWAGLSVWITTPAFVYVFMASLKDKLVKLSWIALITVAAVVFSHGSTGFTQFGYRFAVDFYPFLFLLLIYSVTKTGLKWHHWLLLLISIVVNLWGVLWINKFGWVSF